MQQLNLNNLPICDQIWDDMPASERGRMCQKCQTEIIDFRKMSDLEIAYEHSVGAGRVCGIYSEETESNDKFGYSKTFLVAAFGIMSSASIYAQNVNEIPIIQLDTSNFTINNSDVSVIIEQQIPVVINGVVLGGNDEQLSGISIFVLNSRNGTISNDYGKFTLILNSGILKEESLDLVFSLIGVGRIVKSFPMEELRENGSFEINQIDLIVVTQYKIPVIDKDNSASSFRVSDVDLRSITVKETRSSSFRIISLPWYKRIWFKIKGVFKKKK